MCNRKSLFVDVEVFSPVLDGKLGRGREGGGRQRGRSTEVVTVDGS